MATDYDEAKSNYDNFRYCYENGHQNWLDRAARAIRFRNSEQWDPVDLAKLRRAKRPALTLNIIASLLRTSKGMQRVLRNDVRFSPVSDADNGAAAVMDMLWMHIQNENGFDELETEIYERGLVTGRGYYDIRMEFDHNLRGNVKITGLRSQDVVLDPCIEQYKPETWPQVVTTRWFNPLDIEHLYGKEKADELRNRGLPTWYDYEDEIMGTQLTRIPYYAAGWGLGVDQDLIRGLRVIDRQYFDLKHKELFIDTKSGDTSEIPETWDRARISKILELAPNLSTVKRKVKTVVWTTSCETTLLNKVDSPYNGFTVVPFFPEMYDGYTQGLVEQLIDAQEMHNKLTSQELAIVNGTANSGYKVKVGAVKNMTIEELEMIGSKPGLVLEMDDINNIEKFTPNTLPAGHDRLSAKAADIMRSLSGVSNQARGFAREDVASEAILANQAAADVNFADGLGKLHMSKRLVAERVLDCVQTFYTEERVIMINRGSLYRPDFQAVSINKQTPEGTMLNDVTRGQYTTILVPSPQRSSLTTDEFQQVLELKKLGVQIPDQMMIELSNLPNKQALLQQTQGDSAKQAQEQHEMEKQIHDLQMKLEQAKAEKELSAAELNRARAEKAHAEAQIDPDAAYERVEMARIESERETAQERTIADMTKHTMTHVDKHAARTAATAMDLTKLAQASHEQHAQRRHDVGMQRMDHAHDAGMAELQADLQPETPPGGTSGP